MTPQMKKPHHMMRRFLVGQTREIWNCIFSDLELVCQELEVLDIEAIIGADIKPP
jgi:hypothetical protein